MRIALDAMGGDRAPDVVKEGALLTARTTGHQIILVGPEDRTRVENHPPNLSFRHASEAVAMGEHPTAALREKKDSSIAVGINLVRSGDADAFVSAGNTGAVMAAATLSLGRLQGVERPALAIPFPTDRGVSLLLDVGANADAKPAYLVQFAQMGVAYARAVFGTPEPRVALLNIGEEAGKGSQLAKEAFELLSASGLYFTGNVEGKDLPKGVADVIVTDGFTGNVVIKVAEGVSEHLTSAIRQAVMSRWHYRLAGAVLRPALRTMARRMDYSEFGGAPLLGVRGVVIIAHGRSDPRAISNAILAAARAAEQPFSLD